MSKKGRPRFDRFKEKLLKNPGVRAAYVEAKVKQKRGQVQHVHRRR